VWGKTSAQGDTKVVGGPEERGGEGTCLIWQQKGGASSGTAFFLEGTDRVGVYSRGVSGTVKAGVLLNKGRRRQKHSVPVRKMKKELKERRGGIFSSSRVSYMKKNGFLGWAEVPTQERKRIDRGISNYTMGRSMHRRKRSCNVHVN